MHFVGLALIITRFDV